MIIVLQVFTSQWCSPEIVIWKSFAIESPNLALASWSWFCSSKVALGVWGQASVRVKFHSNPRTPFPPPAKCSRERPATISEFFLFPTMPSLLLFNVLASECNPKMANSPTRKVQDAFLPYLVCRLPRPAAVAIKCTRVWLSWATCNAYWRILQIPPILLVYRVFMWQQSLFPCFPSAPCPRCWAIGTYSLARWCILLLFPFSRHPGMIRTVALTGCGTSCGFSRCLVATPKVSFREQLTMAYYQPWCTPWHVFE